jgi:hypothetical protein
MKLTGALKSSVEDQLGADALPEENPATPKLKEVFGDHTFFVDAEGLSIVEPNPQAGPSDGAVIKVGSWTEDRAQLQLHEPQILAQSVDIGPEDAEEV